VSLLTCALFVLAVSETGVQDVDNLDVALSKFVVWLTASLVSVMQCFKIFRVCSFLKKHIQASSAQVSSLAALQMLLASISNQESAFSLLAAV
jgi:hypothetical protein